MPDKKTGIHRNPSAPAIVCRMSHLEDDENPYLLLTPGPLSTSRSVRRAMLRDWCTWDDDYNHGIVQVIRRKLVELATSAADAENRYTSVLMQGSGTFVVESVIGSVVPPKGRLFVIANGAYGERIAKIAATLSLDCVVNRESEIQSPNLESIEATLANDPKISHVAVVHGETTTGMLNPIREIGLICKKYDRILIVDAMSTFGGVPIDVDSLHVDYIISSANKCIQGVPGFGFAITTRDRLLETKGYARSYSLDLYDQWSTMEQGHGKWRFTSPTHTVRAFAQALVELEEEGGIVARNARYVENHRRLIRGMEMLGFRCLLPADLQSPIITAFHFPDSPDFAFKSFYQQLKERGFVIYPGKVTNVDTFRIGTIGEVYPDDVDRLLTAIQEVRQAAV